MTEDKRQFDARHHQHSYSDLMERIQPNASNAMITTLRIEGAHIRHSVSSNAIGMPANEQATKDVDPGRFSIFSPKPAKTTPKLVRKTTPISKSNIKLVAAPHQNLVTTSSQGSGYVNTSVTSRQQYLNANANTGSNRSANVSEKKEKPLAANSKIPTVQPEDKLRQLREENQKLKDLLKRNEALIESRLAETKLEQQQVITICNLMGPIISALTPSRTGHPPRSFQELIAQLDDLNKQMKAGPLTTSSTRLETDKLKKQVDEAQDRLERQNQLMLKREAEWVQMAHTLREELAELRSFKQQVHLWVCASPAEAELPAFLKMLPVEEWLEEALQTSQHSTLPVEHENPFV